MVGDMEDMEEMEYDEYGNPILRERGIPQFNEEDYDDEEEDETAGGDTDAINFDEFQRIINTEGATNN